MIAEPYEKKTPGSEPRPFFDSTARQGSEVGARNDGGRGGFGNTLFRHE